MKYRVFLSYLEENLDSYSAFMEKARTFQDIKNKKRPAKSRWEDKKITNATYEMWKKAMQPLYDNLKREIKSDAEWMWKDYIEKHGILETINDGISDLEFNED